MRSRKPTDFIICAILLCTVVSGCMLLPGATRRQEIDREQPTDQERRPDTFIVYFYRESSYKGLGRIHDLRIDGKQIGQLTADNYYRIELWPGEYIFSVYLPEEDFFGTKSPAENSSMRLIFRPNSAPNQLIYQYIDGDGIHRVDMADESQITLLKEGRTASANLSARDTAQVKFLFDTRYDGPAKLGKAHGNGTLTWNDGSVFRGRFEYGQLTQDGKFYDSTGRIYLGPKTKGRPIGPGVLTTTAGRIIYAGKFDNEIPHGIGIRSGVEGPEFCVYKNGEDVTKTIWQLTYDALEEEDKQLAEEDKRLSNKNAEVVSLESKIIHEEQETAAPPEEPNGVAVDPDSYSNTDQEVSSPSAGKEEKTKILKDSKGKKETNPQLPLTREDRVAAKYKEINLKIQRQIEEKKAWCQEEFDLERHLCICAPFAADFESWTGCTSR